MEVPRHVGIIMDGNRRWAKERRLSTYRGHLAGADRIEPVVAHAEEKGIEAVSLWAFSTDNWQRKKTEVNALMTVFRRVMLGPMINRLIDKGGKINPIGDLSAFPQDIQNDFQEAIDKSKDNTNITVNIGLNYGGREEIVFAANKAFKRALKEGRKEITEEEISANVYTAGQPEPDLMIRTSGEERHSGFLLWQSKNTEYYYSKVFWPDFDTKEFDKALRSYSQRKRRFGK
jgi:undecaprenyl diphosphate synthase